MTTSVFSATPSVGARDARGLTVRDVAYYRHPGSPDVTSERITRHCYDARGILSQSVDPRLHDAGLANFTYFTDLAGAVLRTQGVDNGTTVSLNDAAGRPFITVSNISTAADGTEDLSQAVTRTWEYEGDSMPGRVLSITEQATGDTARITERFVYAGNADAEKAQNLSGECVSYYDTAGVVRTDSVALTGVPLSVTRCLLKDADNPDVVANWQGADASTWDTLLDVEDDKYSTLTTADAGGAVLRTTDAKGNVLRVAYDVAGLLSGNWLTVKGGEEQVIVRSLTFSAAGQKLRETHGNGVVSTYTYEPQTQRLTGIKTERPAGHVSGAKVLQNLRYGYDPAGNVLRVVNEAESTRYGNSQQVNPEMTYTYDSLYQLVTATGRERGNASQQGNNLPAAIIPLPTDNSLLANYSRTYNYDAAGNLTQIRHSPAAGSGYTTRITVSDRSNRGVLSALTGNAADVDALFTMGGQQKQLQAGQSLVWTPRNELLKVTPVVRDGGTDDRENYRYDAGSQRILKVSTQKTSNSAQTLRTLYLPHLELRSAKSGNTETESLQVIAVGAAGRAQVRVLHWESGRPAGIAGDQIRYSYDNLIGSSSLEVDGAGRIISAEEYYPYGGTAVWTARSQVEADYKTVRYSGKERDATGLYYYGYRYYAPWLCRWTASDPAGTVDGLNLFRMVGNNPVTLRDADGRWPDFFDKNYIGKMDINGEKVEIRKSPWNNAYQIGKNSKLSFQRESVTVNNKIVSFKRDGDGKGFSELYQRWKSNEVTLIRGISSSHFSWNKIVLERTVYSEGDNDVPGATMGGSNSRWLPTALDDSSNRIMVAGIAQGNHTEDIKDAMRNQENDGGDVLAGAILTFSAGKDKGATINYLYDGEIALRGPVSYPDFKIDSIITGNITLPVSMLHIEKYDEVLPLSAPYLPPGASSQEVGLAQEMAQNFLRKGRESLARIRESAQSSVSR